MRGRGGEGEGRSGAAFFLVLSLVESSNELSVCLWVRLNIFFLVLSAQEYINLKELFYENVLPTSCSLRGVDVMETDVAV